MLSVPDHSKVYPDSDKLLPLFLGTNCTFDNKHIINIWEKVCLKDMDSFETIHAILYPVFFKQTNDVLKNANDTDVILEDAFVHFWYNSKLINGNTLIAYMAKYISQKLKSYLSLNAIDCRFQPENVPYGINMTDQAFVASDINN